MAASMFVPTSNSKTTVPAPSLLWLVMRMRRSILFNWSSCASTISLSISCGLAPRQVVSTVMRSRSTVGVSWIGIPKKLIRPNRVINSTATVTLTGRVYAMSDSVADAWVAGGGITEGNRILAVFAESFFEAEEVTGTAQPQPDTN